MTERAKRVEVKVVMALAALTGISSHVALECRQERLELALYSR